MELTFVAYYIKTIMNYTQKSPTMWGKLVLFGNAGYMTK